MEIVVRTANRLIVGAPLCRDAEFCDLMINFSMSVFKSALTIHLFPKFLHPIVGRIFTGRKTAMKRLKKYLKPIIEERLRMKEKYGDDWDKPNDFIQWSIDAEQFAPLSQRFSTEDLCARVLILNFGAIDTTSVCLPDPELMVLVLIFFLAETLYRLAFNSDIIESLRNEVESVIRKEGRTKAAVMQMRLLDSFLKESVRLSPGSAIGVFRKTMSDFTFSDGTTVPSGTIVAAATWPILRDDKIYPNGAEFKPFRFAEMREEDGESTKHHFTTVNSEWMFFGQGRHACPGRFFASTEIKAFLAHILLNYDVKFPDDSREVPERSNIQLHVGPDTNARVLFRKRKPKVVE
ncbi:hypothetical protein VKT23_010540 [Stygiomarasmius scandens]|uniref:Cytochrome P450 n=1 Tax=Marasmiellus scandens TaxID=2682957 RepID=A0ABR1JEG6_9AGAR